MLLALTTNYLGYFFGIKVFIHILCYLLFFIFSVK